MTIKAGKIVSGLFVIAIITKLVATCCGIIQFCSFRALAMNLRMNFWVRICEVCFVLRFFRIYALYCDTLDLRPTT